jgi:HTH-type transcriptional regulator/antitoxin HigA
MSQAAEVFHPAEYIRRELRARRWHDGDFGQMAGCTVAHAIALRQGKVPITHEEAVRLSRAFGTSVEFWENLQNSWDRKS